MSITELLDKIGADNIRFQMLHDCITDCSSSKKKGNRVTFVTNAIGPADLIADKPNKIGMVLWIPYEKWKEATADMVKP